MAPNQYEMAPIYEHSAAAADHNMLMMVKSLSQILQSTEQTPHITQSHKHNKATEFGFGDV